MLLWLMNLDLAGGGTPAEEIPTPSPGPGWKDNPYFRPVDEPEKKEPKKRKKRPVVVEDVKAQKVKGAINSLGTVKIPPKAKPAEILEVVTQTAKGTEDADKLEALQLIEDEIVAMMLLGMDIPEHNTELTLAEFMLLLM